MSEPSWVSSIPPGIPGRFRLVGRPRADEGFCFNQDKTMWHCGQWLMVDDVNKGEGDGVLDLPAILWVPAHGEF